MEPSKLMTYLECPMCYLLPRSKIFICTNSHKICESCYITLRGDVTKHCPQGGCDYDQPPRRVRDYEAIIENSDFELPCSKPGCNVELKKEPLAAHEVKCSFRTVPCPAVECGLNISFQNIDSHIQDNHKYKITCKLPKIEPFLKEESLNAVDMDWVFFTWSQNELQFYPQFVKREGLWYFWMKIKEDPIAAANWEVSAKVENVENQISLEFKGLVHPVDRSVEEILESGHYLQLNRKSVIKFKISSEVAIEKGYSDIIRVSFKIIRK